MVIRIIGNDEAVLDGNSCFAKSIHVVLLMYGRYGSIQGIGKNDDFLRRMTGDLIHKIHWIDEVAMSRHITVSISRHCFVPVPYGHVA